MIRKGLYRHYKGGIYKVLGECKHTETLDKLVVYECTKNKQIWVRPLKMFLESIGCEQRFVKIEK